MEYQCRQFRSRGDVGLSFFNGESHRLEYPIKRDDKNYLRPLPSLIKFHSENLRTGDIDLYIIRFDCAELIDAFNQFSDSGNISSFEISPQAPKKDTRIRLINGDNYVDLKKYDVEEF